MNLTWNHLPNAPQRNQIEHLEQAANDLLRREDSKGATLPLSRYLGPARELQCLHLPKPDQIEGHTLCSTFRPLEIVGGDMIAVFENRSRPLIVLADASGHDAGAAMAASMTRALISREAEDETCLETLVRRVDETLQLELPTGWFVTAFFVELDPQEDSIRYLGAGHPPALLDIPGGSTPHMLASEAGALGIGAYAAAAQTASWKPGSRLLLYSDGLEAGYETLSATQSLSRRFQAARAQPLQGLKNSLLGEDGKIAAHEKDDVSLIAIERL